MYNKLTLSLCIKNLVSKFPYYSFASYLNNITSRFLAIKNYNFKSEFRIGNSILKNNGKGYFLDTKNNIVEGYEALRVFIEKVSKKSQEKNSLKILDIGCGKNQPHTNILKENNLSTETCDFFDNCNHVGFYEDIKFKHKFDAIWCCMVLEHTLNPNQFLSKIRSDIKEGGVLSITVPPLKHEIVGGHVNLFNAGLLLYRLVVAGFDCSSAYIKQYGYNVSVVMEVKKIKKMPKLNYDNGDIEKLSSFFPVKVYQGFNGNDKQFNLYHR